jgi:hypothetical protein
MICRTRNVKVSHVKHVSQEKLRDYIVSLFLAIVDPVQRSYETASAEYPPMNLVSFVLTLERLFVSFCENSLKISKKIGYPSHWISAIVEEILSGTVTAAATSPLTTPDKVPATAVAKSKIDTSPYVLDLEIITSLSMHRLPFGISWEVCLSGIF